MSAESGQFSRWGRGARLTRRVREEYRVYFDRNATQNGAKRSGSAGMHRRSSPHRENWAAWVSPQAVNSLWIKWREHRERRGARLTRRVREEYRVYSDRNATMRAAKRHVSAGMHRRSNAASLCPQAVKSREGNAGQSSRWGVHTGTTRRRRGKPRTADCEEARGRLGTPASGRHRAGARNQRP